MERIVGTFEDYETYKKEQDKLALEKQAQQPKQNNGAKKSGLSYKENENMKL